jgi:hypothetical protein
LKRTAFVVCLALAVAGSFGVWWLSRYLNGLVTLAQTDREASLALFRSRVLPGLFVIVAVSAAAGAVLIRQGMRVVKESRVMGWMMGVAGFIIAAIPTALLALVLWLLGRA